MVLLKVMMAPIRAVITLKFSGMGTREYKIRQRKTAKDVLMIRRPGGRKGWRFLPVLAESIKSLSFRIPITP